MTDETVLSKGVETPLTENPGRIIRLATKDDVENIINFVDKSGMVFHSKETIRRMVLGDNEGRKPYIIGLALVEGNIIGVSIVSAKSKTLSLLFVSVDFRKYGIGKELLKLTSPKQILLKIESLGYFCKVYR
jgi:hypothetical protein